MPERFHRREFASLAELNAALRDLVQESLQRENAVPHAVMLSGGRTPVPVYEAIAREPFPIAATAWITYTDDRHVPVENPHNNYWSSQPMLEALQVPPERVIRVHPELSLEESAQDFDKKLAGFFEQGGRIALGLLGVGPDGHTCSLFDESDLERGKGRLAIPVYRPDGPDRVSVTLELLSKIERIIFMIAGSEKTDIARQLYDSPETTIAGRAVRHCPQVEIWQA